MAQNHKSDLKSVLWVSPLFLISSPAQTDELFHLAARTDAQGLKSYVVRTRKWLVTPGLNWDVNWDVNSRLRIRLDTTVSTESVSLCWLHLRFDNTERFHGLTTESGGADKPADGGKYQLLRDQFSHTALRSAAHLTATSHCVHDKVRSCHGLSDWTIKTCVNTIFHISVSSVH